MRFHEIPKSRQDELEKLATSPEHLQEITTATPPTRSVIMKQIARQALGLAPEHDIADLTQPTQSELLFVMRAMRDTVFPPQPDDTIETI